MKNIFLLLTALVLSGFTVNADTKNTSDDGIINNTYVRGYGNSFIFEESGIEFSVYADGQFDFYMPNYGPKVNVEINNRNTSISFNTGYDYGAYVQYDEFGAIIQVENTPVYYDYYGRVNQVGNVYINYNSRGYVNRVGGLYVHYNRYNRYSHCTGFINVYNRAYVYRAWHSYYTLPSAHYRVVYTTPYRQHYTPTRYRYDRPYLNNSRRRTAVANRRGNSISRNRSLASRNDGRTPRVNSTPRTRNNRATTTPRTRGNRTVNATPRTRNNSATTSTPRTRGNQTTTSTPRTRNNSATTSTPRTRGNQTTTSTPRTRSNSATTSTPRTRGNQTTTSTPRTRSNTKSTTTRKTTSKPRTTSSRSSS
ncbi:hypothetical protein [Olleya sp. HaHaR_3_96]|uniref:hypothetical protein n=1 Tax=Olleya sp. HaHaR_3_96 TaxID=2745560 RepID=UPI001C4EAAA0|nr:hypothetical protein [Olleya sp. HaHaR_3_96]QXP59041.1 hypothetical protein H0I26_14100 [Olleya sp. HaHaR_3_96]